MAEFSPAQRRALDLSTHVAITAAAGSGKTTVLVERIIKILEKNGFQPEQIVAITFTEEAAAQIKEGVRKRMEDKISGAHRLQEGWEEVYSRLSLAKITTIHGFCFSLLKEYPLEAGLDPGFSVLSPGEQRLRLLECIRESLQDLSGSFDPNLETLLDYIPRSLLEPIFLEMIERRSYLGQFVTGDPEGQAKWFEPLQDLYRQEVAQALLRLNLWNELTELLTDLPEELAVAGGSYARRCAAQRNLLLQKGDLPADQFLQRFSETFSIRVNPSKKWKKSSHYEPLRQLWSTLRQELQKHPLNSDFSDNENRHFTRALTALRSLYDRILKRYQEQKAKSSDLDFEDLLVVTARLVTQTRVSQSLIQRYRFLLVDEFQDTNELQWKILRRLIGPGSNFFAVGDAKQSIYRFRDADVTVFRELQRWIGTAGRLVEMSENYRSLPSLIEFHNCLFRTLFRPGLGYEAAHQEMLPRRVQEPARARPSGVEVFFYDAAPASETSFEARKTARWVNRLVKEEGFHYSDIAILLRARTRLKEYEEGLRGEGVPFYTVAGIGFYERQEVLDLLNLLRFLTNPRNDLALLGILRSPFFNLSDEDLFLLSMGPAIGYWKKLQNAADGAPMEKVLPAWDRGSWEFAVKRLRCWIEESQQQPIATFLRRAVRDTGYLEILSASPRGAQNSRNIRKFLDLVRAFEKDRRRSCRELLRFMDALMKGEPREAEAAAYDELGEVVRIYTMHGAKGLQFPVVILPELGNPLFSGRKNLFYFQTLHRGSSSQTFFGLKIWNPDDRYRDLEHSVYKMLHRLDEFRQIAEEKRLLYVATTRARDRLILIGQRTKYLSYARWLCETGADAYCSKLKPLPARIEKAGKEDSKVETAAPLSLQLNFDSRGTISKKLAWTPTELVLFSRCPYKYYLSRLERLSGDPPLGWKEHENKEALVGLAVHEMLEGSILNSALVERRLQRWKQRHQNLFTPQELGAMREKIRRQLRQVAAHPFYQRISQAHELHSEKAFHVQEDGLMITGTIDKLFQERDHRWAVVDFKTSETASSEISAKIEQEGYDLQVQIYLWAISRILSTDDVEGFLFFTHTGDLIPIRFDPGVAQKCETLIASLPRDLQRSHFPKTPDVSCCYRCGFYRQGVCPGAEVPSLGPEQKSFW